MRPEARTNLESLGYTISELQLSSGKTKTYVTHPMDNPNDPFAGWTLAWFDKLYEVFPDAVDPENGVGNEEYFDIDYYCLPEEVAYEGIRVDNFRWLPAGASYDDLEHDAEGNLVWPWFAWILLVMVITMLIGVMFTMWTRHIQVSNAPCGPEGSEWYINDCWKMVIAPDCSYRSFNSCANDGEGEWEGDWRKDIPDWTDIIIWAIIGAVIIGGTVIAVKLIPKIKSRRQQLPSRPPPSNWQTHPAYTRY